MLRRLPLLNPKNRFERFEREYDEGEHPSLGLELYDDQTRSILSKNDSPDLPFRYGLNPYRGCAHGCAYCYARPSHEYLGWGSGADFERRLLVKRRAPELLRAAFDKPNWKGELVVISTNTDAYQPLEAKLRLTRQCLEVCAEYGNPVHIITRSALVERDIDVLQRLNERASVGVSVSVTFWSTEVARALEPYAPPPSRRIETIRRLSEAGINVMVHVAPLIPGLSDSDLIPILEAARQAGARSAISTLVRLPGSLAQVFEERLRAALPLRADKVLKRIREMRSGQLNDSRFFARHRGRGEYAETLEQMFTKTAHRLGFTSFPPPRSDGFARPTDRGGQLRLF